MSKKLHAPALTMSPELVMVACRFQVTDPSGTADPDALVPALAGVTDVVRTAEGCYDIYLDEKYPTLVACVGSVEYAASVATNGASIAVVPGVANGSSVYNSTTGVLSIRTVDADDGASPGKPAAADPADNSWVHVIAVFCRRSALAPSGSI